MKLTKKLSFLASYSLPGIVVGTYYAGGPSWTFSGVLFAYIIVPLLDEWIGRDPDNVRKHEFEVLLQDRYFDILVYSHVYIQYALLFWGCAVLSFDPLTGWQALGLIFSLGVYASTIINVAHELGHRHHPVAQFHTRLALLSVSYMHFVIEHNRGHHVNVATPHDPATSYKNQSVYSFWKQSIAGGFYSAWHLEKKRLIRLHQPMWSMASNEMIRFVLLPVLLLLGFTFFYSWLVGKFIWIVPVYFIAQSIIAILSLECVNYIEHYGIVRKQLPSGRYEKVNPLHSWNANHLLSNLLLFQLQRHSDHHAYASRPYQILRHFDESPQLPFGYPVMIMLSLVPPLWFRIMNPRLEDWQVHACSAKQINSITRQFV